MHAISMIAAIALAGVATAQDNCMRQVASSFSVDGERRNLMQGEYGGANVTYTIADGELSVVPQTEENAYWFVKFDTAECFDATPYQAIAYDIRLPPGGDMMVTWTGHMDDCVTRTPDSTYVSVLDYVHATHGDWMKIVIPFTAVQNLSDGSGLFDYTHVKDYTFFFTPYNEEFLIDNIELIGVDCDLQRLGAPDVATTSSAIVPSSTTRAPATNSAEPTQKEGPVGSVGLPSGATMTSASLLASLIGAVLML